MNKHVLLYMFIAIFTLVMSWEYEQEAAIAKFHHEVGKKEAIRLRILAHSDSIQDQLLKRNIRDAVNEQIAEWVHTIEDASEAKAVISSRLPEIELIVEGELKKLGQQQPFSVAFSSTLFPTRLYGEIIYPAGTYEAVVITLGEGKGENWWCVLFPPLCFLDFDENEAEEGEEVEVRFFIVDVISKIGSFFTKEA